MIHDLLHKRISTSWNLVALKAKLQGVSGFTGQGDVRFFLTRSGVKKLEVDLRGIAGISADLFVHGEQIISTPLTNGRTSQKFTTEHGDPIPDIPMGAGIEIRQNGELILKGILA